MIAPTKLTTWTCDRPGCPSRVDGVGDGRGLVAIGWRPKGAGVARCPLHPEDDLDPVEVSRVATEGAMSALARRALLDVAERAARRSS